MSKLFIIGLDCAEPRALTSVQASRPSSCIIKAFLQVNTLKMMPFSF